MVKNTIWQDGQHVGTLDYNTVKHFSGYVVFRGLLSLFAGQF